MNLDLKTALLGVIGLVQTEKTNEDTGETYTAFTLNSNRLIASCAAGTLGYFILGRRRLNGN